LSQGVISIGRGFALGISVSSFLGHRIDRFDQATIGLVDCLPLKQTVFYADYVSYDSSPKWFLSVHFAGSWQPTLRWNRHLVPVPTISHLAFNKCRDGIGLQIQRMPAISFPGLPLAIYINLLIETPFSKSRTKNQGMACQQPNGEAAI